MSEVKVKRCKLCGGEPKFVYYCIPESDHPDAWYEDDDGKKPYILFKRLECSNCGATVPRLMMAIDDVVDYWNGQNILERYGEEKAHNVEEDEE